MQCNDGPDVPGWMAMDWYKILKERKEIEMTVY